jgi:hypothetical protein
MVMMSKTGKKPMGWREVEMFERQNLSLCSVELGEELVVEGEVKIIKMSSKFLV